MAAVLVQRELDFYMRVDATGWNVVNNFLRSNMTETWVILEPPRQGAAHDYELERTPTRVRILMTSLLDAERYLNLGDGVWKKLSNVYQASFASGSC